LHAPPQHSCREDERLQPSRKPLWTARRVSQELNYAHTNWPKQGSASGFIALTRMPLDHWINAPARQAPPIPPYAHHHAATAPSALFHMKGTHCCPPGCPKTVQKFPYTTVKLTKAHPDCPVLGAARFMSATLAPHAPTLIHARPVCPTFCAARLMSAMPAPHAPTLIHAPPVCPTFCAARFMSATPAPHAPTLIHACPVCPTFCASRFMSATPAPPSSHVDVLRAAVRHHAPRLLELDAPATAALLLTRFPQVSAQPAAVDKHRLPQNEGPAHPRGGTKISPASCLPSATPPWLAVLTLCG